jgi:DNA-binding PadR family transcriptional regulator
MELLRGTLDLLILAMLRDGPLHGYGIASAIRRSTRSMLAVQEGVLYPTLKKLEARGILKAAWGFTESGREARYYEIDGEGQKAAGRSRRRLEIVCTCDGACAEERVR